MLAARFNPRQNRRKSFFGLSRHHRRPDRSSEPVPRRSIGSCRTFRRQVHPRITRAAPERSARMRRCRQRQSRAVVPCANRRHFGVGRRLRDYERSRACAVLEGAHASRGGTTFLVTASQRATVALTRNRAAIYPVLGTAGLEQLHQRSEHCLIRFSASQTTSRCWHPDPRVRVVGGHERSGISAAQHNRCARARSGGRRGQRTDRRQHHPRQRRGRSGGIRVFQLRPRRERGWRRRGYGGSDLGEWHEFQCPPGRGTGVVAFGSSHPSFDQSRPRSPAVPLWRTRETRHWRRMSSTPTRLCCRSTRQALPPVHRPDPSGHPRRQQDGRFDESISRPIAPPMSECLNPRRPTMVAMI